MTMLLPFAALALGLLEAPDPPKSLLLGPRDVVVVANANLPASLEVARHYLQKRGVPEDHLIALPLPTGEDISRADFDELLKKKLFAELQRRRPSAKILLMVHGVPLRVGAASPNEAEQKKLAELNAEKDRLTKLVEPEREKLKAAEKAHKERPTAETARVKEAAQKKVNELDAKLQSQDGVRLMLTQQDSQAAVDSELALLWWPKYPLARWQLNPINWRVPAALRAKAPPVLMTARIDGPTPALCKRLIDDAVEIEAKGLTGKLWVDSRGIQFNPAEDPTGTSYGGYDQSLRELHRLVKDKTKFPSVIDVKPELFAEGACKECALYCGWYSHAAFVDCCVFRKGAVAVHIASSEAVSLRDPNCRFWCKNQLEHGACATMGPVAEPYLFAFPRPEEFFGFLMTGEYTLAECFWSTASVASWQMTLIGDPLYRPFAKNPQLKPADVKPSPEGAKSMYQ